MSHSASTLILDDDPSSRQLLQAACEFLDRSCLFMTYVDWLQAGEESSDLYGISVILLGQSQLPISLEKLVLELRGRFPAAGIITLGNLTESESLSPEVSEQVLGQLSLPLSYSALIDLLHKAQVAVDGGMGTHQRNLSEVFSALVGAASQMQRVRQSMAKVAERDVNVLITGESGTGKEVVARSLHEHSDRRGGPFVPINCGAIPADLLESELFGHEKGAFTGAVSSRAGRFELANGGTLFLDEIGDMPLPMQVKLLRVLQERKFERIGGSKTLDADIRLIAATHKDLEKMIEEEQFREDLYYRINVFPIEMPALASRTADIPLLIEELVKRLKNQGLDTVRFHPSAIASLQKHAWPGNVRELANLIERMAIMYPNGIVGVSELPERFRHIEEPDPARYEQEVGAAEEAPEVVTGSANAGRLDLLPEEGVDLKQHLELIERRLMEQSLERNGGVVARAAESLQIRRTTLVEKMRKYGMQRK